MQIKLLKQNVLRLMAIAIMGFWGLSMIEARNPVSSEQTMTEAEKKNTIELSLGQELSFSDFSNMLGYGDGSTKTDYLKGSDEVLYKVTGKNFGLNNGSFQFKKNEGEMTIANVTSPCGFTLLITHSGDYTTSLFFGETKESALSYVNHVKTYKFAGTSTAITLKGSTQGTARITNITFNANTTVPVTIPSSTGYATFSSQYPLDFTDVSGIKAYIATADGVTGVNFKRVKKIPANTGVLLVSTSGGAVDATEVPYLTGSADNVEGNVFVAVNTDTNISSTSDGNSNYILYYDDTHEVGFYKANGQTVGAGKAYISVPASTQVKGFIALPGNDDATGVSTVKATAGKDVIYNLAGQRLVHSLWRGGVLVQNGKKFIVK